MKNKKSFKPFPILLLLTLLCCIFLSCLVLKEASQSPPQYQIKLRNRTFIPQPGIDTKVMQYLKSSTSPNINIIMQFQKNLSLTEHKLLVETGIYINDYLGSNTYAVSIRKDTNLDNENLKKIIRWIGPFVASDKFDYQLTKKNFYNWAIDKESGNIKLLVQFFKNVDANTIKNDLASISIKGSKYGADNSWVLLVDRDKLSQIAELNSVKMIQQGPIPFLPLNNGGRRVANTDEAQQETYNSLKPAYNKVSGDGIRIGICDNGVDENSNDLAQITTIGTTGVSRVYSQRPESGSHGSHVAGIAGGNGFNSIANGFPAFILRGHAPRVEIGEYQPFSSNVQLYYDAIVTDNTNVTNHSYIQSFSIYDSTAESLDLIVRGDAIDANGNLVPARPQVWAAGNNGTRSQPYQGDEEGYYSVFTSAKNTISVGSIDTIDRHLSNFSSIGPTFDGRIKPELMAPGATDSINSVGIMSIDAGTQRYASMQGTSMAAPVVSGTIALMMEQFLNTYGTLPNHPSTYKAMLIHTAKDMVKTEAYSTREFNNPDHNHPVLYHTGPDFTTGYGLVDTDAARNIVTKTDQWKESSINFTNEMKIWCITVPEGSHEIKVVIAWDDEPGSTLNAENASKLVNDLDLKLIDPDGNSYLPWVLPPLPLTANPGDGNLDPIQSDDVDPAYRGADHINNVEVVNVFLPKKGIWKAVVTGFNLPNGNIQSFSIISSHHINSLCYRLPPQFCQMYPQLCRQFDICKRYPWICNIDYDIEPILPIDQGFEIDTRTPIPMDEICKYVVDCPGCEGAGWSYCPGWRMEIERVPRDSIISIVNLNGEIITEDKTTSTSRTLILKQQQPGMEYFLIITDSKGNPYSQKLKLALKIKAL